MFSRYWRSYPWWLQLILFGLMVFIFISLSQVAAYVIVPKATGADLADIAPLTEKSSLSAIKGAYIWQAISAIGLFLVPSLLFAHLAHPRPAKYLGLVKPGKAIQPFLAIIAMVAATPVFLFIATLVHMIGLGPGADAMQLQNDNMIKIFLSAAPQIGFFVVLLVMAILPAISEEVFFRGIFLRFAKKRSTNMVVPIAISAMAFALAHGTPYSFLAIFFAGVALAIIYNLTGSLWCSMLAHMCYNGFQVSLSYFGKDSAIIKGVMESNSVPVPFLLIGAAVSAIAFYLLWKFRTPLPPTWADDYTQEELSEKAV
jgi:membrane protease YdiL (CAAX protease family)